MNKKTAVISPLLQASVANGLESVAELLFKKLLAHQTVTMLFDSPDSQEDPKNLPALLVSRLPGDDWILELPLPPITPEDGLGSKVQFFIFNDWIGPGEEIAGSFSCGPKKLIHEPDSRTLATSMLSAVEDLLLVADRMDVGRILIADKSGEVSDGLGKSITRLLSSNSDSISLLPACSSFFDEAELSYTPSKDQTQQIAKKFLELESLLDEKSISFYASTCYMGLPRNLFVLDYSTDELAVSVWNGSDFVSCKEPHTIRAIRKQGQEPQPGGPKQLPSVYVSNLWPEALKRLGLPLLSSEGEI